MVAGFRGEWPFLLVTSSSFHDRAVLGITCAREDLSSSKFKITLVVWRNTSLVDFLSHIAAIVMFLCRVFGVAGVAGSMCFYQSIVDCGIGSSRFQGMTKTRAAWPGKIGTHERLRVLGCAVEKWQVDIITATPTLTPGGHDICLGTTICTMRAST